MSTVPTLSLRSTADLVATMPYLLGYHPRDALVLVCLRGGRICLTACQPLLPGGDPPPVLDALLAGMAKADPEAVIVLGYENTTPVAGITRAVAEVCAEVGVPVHDRIIVTANGWQSLNSGDGTGSPAGSASAVAELVGAGIAPLPSRDALTAAVQPAGDEVWVARHIVRYTARGDDPDLLNLYCSAWPVVLDTGDDAPTVTAKVAARAVMALASITVRDLVVARLTPGTLDATAIPGNAGALLRTLPAPPWQTETGWELIRTCARLQDRLVRLCAMTPDSHAAPPLSVLASWAWWHGDGALARVALDRALHCAPEYRLALLLQRMVDLAIRPRK
jgi:hypothetical protein